jgi:hypothetical protein
MSLFQSLASDFVEYQLLVNAVLLVCAVLIFLLFFLSQVVTLLWGKLKMQCNISSGAYG